GCHYRWPGWIELTKRHGIIRSMSAKGCSPDNAGCESFFGHLKTECFFGRDFRCFSLEKFTNYIENYLLWYSQKRIKSTLNYVSLKQYKLNSERVLLKQ
ncbi:IS3 family transposase, partial [Turicimonas muris]